MFGPPDPGPRIGRQLSPRVPASVEGSKRMAGQAPFAVLSKCLRAGHHPSPPPSALQEPNGPPSTPPSGWGQRLRLPTFSLALSPVIKTSDPEMEAHAHPRRRVSPGTDKRHLGLSWPSLPAPSVAVQAGPEPPSNHIVDVVGPPCRQTPQPQRRFIKVSPPSGSWRSVIALSAGNLGAACHPPVHCARAPSPLNSVCYPALAPEAQAPARSGSAMGNGGDRGSHFGASVRFAACWNTQAGRPTLSRLVAGVGGPAVGMTGGAWMHIQGLCRSRLCSH